eukprot:scaffold245164_cov39-Prasinocladus_malaysianus.AAC.1
MRLALICLTWQVLASQDSLRDEEPTSFTDRAFDNAMNQASASAYECYNNLLFRDVLKHGFYDLIRARDVCRSAMSA